MKPEHAGELRPPPAALHDPRALELLRMWGADKAQHVTLRADVWDDPAYWGIALADLARHVARAYAQRAGRADEYQRAFSRILTAFNAESTNPTDRPQGSIG